MNGSLFREFGAVIAPLSLKIVPGMVESITQVLQI